MASSSASSPSSTTSSTRIPMAATTAQSSFKLPPAMAGSSPSETAAAARPIAVASSVTNGTAATANSTASTTSPTALLLPTTASAAATTRRVSQNNVANNSSQPVRHHHSLWMVKDQTEATSTAAGLTTDSGETKNKEEDQRTAQEGKELAQTDSAEQKQAGTTDARDNVQGSTLMCSGRGQNSSNEHLPGQRHDSTAAVDVPDTPMEILPSAAPVAAKSRKKRPRPKSEAHATGRWTEAEHQAFLAGLASYGREWKRVALHIPTRTSAQVRSHAQKYFCKLQQQQQQQQQQHQHSPTDPVEEEHISPSVRANVERILAQPASVQAEVEDTLQRLRQRYRQLQQRLESAPGSDSQSQTTLESLQDSELIALHVLQGGLPSHGSGSSRGSSNTEDGNESQNRNASSHSDKGGDASRERFQ